MLYHLLKSLFIFDRAHKSLVDLNKVTRHLCQKHEDHVAILHTNVPPQKCPLPKFCLQNDFFDSLKVLVGDNPGEVLVCFLLEHAAHFLRLSVSAQLTEHFAGQTSRAHGGESLNRQLGLLLERAPENQSGEGS